MKAGLRKNKRLRAFAPMVSDRSRAIILGTMPSAASLAKQEYYGHARNAFWPIIGDIFGGRKEEYRERERLILENHLALWDVIASCVRSGSADSNIRSVRANAFREFFSTYPGITTIFFNGKTSCRLFSRYVISRESACFERITMMTLPSTSPANARMTYSDKLEIWRPHLLAATGR